MPTTSTSDGSTPVWFITDATSGFGATTVLAALQAGHRVVATARNPDSLADLVAVAPTRVLPVRLDLRDPATITEAVSKAESHFGQIDYLFNNAGVVTIGAIEELDNDLLADQIQINLLGPLAVVRAVPYQRMTRQSALCARPSPNSTASSLAIQTS